MNPSAKEGVGPGRKQGWSEPEVITLGMKLAFFARLTLMILWMILSSLLMLPVALARWKNPYNNKLYGNFYGPLSRKILGIKVVLEGEEHLTAHQPCIYVANHQSGADMSTVERGFPSRAILIGKKELLYIPVWGLMYVAFGNIRIDRKNRSHSVAGLNVAVDALKRDGLSIYIFPEGTRNKSGIGLLPFKKGAFHMAIAAQVPIVPVVCSSLAKLVNFQRKYALPGTIYVRVLPPVPSKGMGPRDSDALSKQVRDRMLEALAELNERP